MLSLSVAFFACLLSVVAYCTKLAYRIVRNRKRFKELDDQCVASPGEPHSTYGHMMEIFVKNGHRHHEYMCEAFQRLGVDTLAVRKVIFDRIPVQFFTANPDIVKHILKDEFDNYIKTLPDGDASVYGFQNFLGTGIFATSHGPGSPDNGKSWYWQRKITSLMFTANEFKTFIFDSFSQKSDTLVEELEKHAGKVVDLQSYFFKYTMDAFGQIAFNADFDTMKGKSNAYGEAFDGAHTEWLSFARRHALFATFMQIVSHKNYIRRAVEFVLDRTVPSLKAFNAHKATMLRYTTDVIMERKAVSHSDPRSESKDILGLFIKALEEDNKIKHNADSDEQFLTDVVLNLIIAGRDTTACMLSWAFYELARNPEVLAKLRSELEGADSDDYQSMKDQPYLMAVLYEANRLWPPVPFDGKIVVASDELPGGLQVRAGDQITFCPYVMGRDPKRYPEPQKFRPERWLQEGSFKQPNLYEFPNFQAGPRVCLGMNFAFMEACVAATKLIQNFDFALEKDEELLPDAGKVTMSIMGSLNMIITPRNH